MKQFSVRCQKFLFVLAIYVDVTTINCYFNPFMDSEYFSIDWAGRESSDDVSNVNRLFTLLRLFYGTKAYTSKHSCCRQLSVAIIAFSKSKDKDDKLH